MFRLLEGVGMFRNTIIVGTFAPSLSASIRHTENVSFGANSTLEIGGTTAGSQHDKLIDSGLLTLNGTLLHT
jgi:hypothetical protein